MMHNNEYIENLLNSRNLSPERTERLRFNTIPDDYTKPRTKLEWEIALRQPPIDPYVLYELNNGIVFILYKLQDGTSVIVPVQANQIPSRMPRVLAQEIHIYHVENQENGMTVLEIICVNNQQPTFSRAYTKTEFITFPLYSANPMSRHRVEGTDKNGMTQVIITKADGFSYHVLQPTPLVQYYPVWQGSTPDEKGGLLNPKQMEIYNIITGFIEKYKLVALKKDTIFYFNRANSRNRHLPISAKDLEKNFYDYLDSYPFQKQPSKEDRKEYFERLQKFFNDEIKEHQHGMRNLNQLKSTQVMFENGYYDLNTKTFTEISPENRGNYFTLFSIDIPFDATKNTTTIFDKLLCDMLKDNPDRQKRGGEPSYSISEKIHFVYQIIGALITPKSLKRSMFLFQGVSHGGKTRLSKLIAKLLPQNDVRRLSSLSKLDDVAKYGLQDPVRLVYFKEAHGSKVSMEKFANLKGMSLDDGDDDICEMPLKFLINTNHKIEVSLQNGRPASLTNRIVVLPFATEMDNTGDDVKDFEDAPDKGTDLQISYFEQEKMAIIHKALDAFSEVIHNGNQFCCDFPINICVEEKGNDAFLNTSEIDEVMLREQQSFLPTKGDNRNNAVALLQRYFEPTDKPTDGMTTDKVIEIINKAIPGTYDTTIKNNAVVGRDISAAFGGNVKLDSTKRRYNMQLKQLEPNT